jgi:crotonobetainyl-CoA:carnitine CoA-transferase CaiB-like acyl-CoA transferase
MGVVSPGKSPNCRTFECKDGLVVSGTTISRGRQPLREWLTSEGLGGNLSEKKWDAVFLEGSAVSKDQKDYIDELARTLASRHSKEEFMFKAQEKKIQVGKINSVRDVMEDSHFQQREYFAKVEHPELNEAITYAGAPFKSNDISWSYRRRAPFIGEHNQEIYEGELGLTKQELSILKQGGVI